MNERIKECPKCKHQWEEPCEQTASIILFSECLSCRRFVLTDQEIEQIQEKNRNDQKLLDDEWCSRSYY